MNLFNILVLVLVFVMNCDGHEYYWLEAGTVCRRTFFPDDKCIHYSNCSPSETTVIEAHPEFCHFSGVRAALCCVEDDAYDSDWEEPPPYHHKEHATKPNTPYDTWYNPSQKLTSTKQSFIPQITTEQMLGDEKPTDERVIENPQQSTVNKPTNVMGSTPAPTQTQNNQLSNIPTNPPVVPTQMQSNQSRPQVPLPPSVVNLSLQSIIPQVTTAQTLGDERPPDQRVDENSQQSSISRPINLVGNNPFVTQAQNNTPSNIPTNRPVVPIQMQNQSRPQVPLPASVANLVSLQRCRDYFTQVPLLKGKHTPILGGRPARAKEFPHLALLGFGEPDNIQWSCGGTLISEEYVLTAAHCVNLRYTGPVRYIRLGELDIENTGEDADVKDFEVREILRHPLYNFSASYYDIAVLRMNATVSFSSYIRPACLGLTRNLENAIMVAAGWGLTEEGGVRANILQRATLKHVDNERCKKAYGTPRNLKQGIIEDIQICADGGSERRDACQGDSGGPLQYTNYDFESNFGGFIEVVGVTSFGKGCGLTAGGYTRVLPFVPWIESIVWPN